MNYHPRGMQMWDAWYWLEGETAHAFHLQRLSPNSTRTEAESDGIGHAVSNDLVHWEERPVALLPGPPGSMDDMGLFTGCTHKANGKCYTFYTMRGSTEQGRVQRLGAAVSTDPNLDVWEKLAENPVIVPDGKYYSTPDNPAAWGTVDCRDLCVINAPDVAGYYGYFAARQNAEEMPQGAVIACCFSKDLIHWEQLPPAFMAERFTIVEVPEVFYLDGRWYMLLLCNNEYGNRDIFPGEPRLTMGTVYAVSDQPQGPFKLQEDYILMASETYNGISCRTLLFQGQRMVLYTSVDRQMPYDSACPCMGVLSTPKCLQVRGGNLRMMYSPLIEAYLRETLFTAETAVHTGRLPYETAGKWLLSGSTVTGAVKTAWSRYNFDAVGRSFVYTCTVTVHSGVGAGLVFKATPNGYGGCVYMLDVEKGEAQLLRLPNLAVLDCRKVPLRHGQAYQMRVVSKDQYLELFLDDVLVLQDVHYAVREGYFGLMADRTTATFSQPKGVRLDCPESSQ